MSVRARSVVVTGANRGLGLEMVRQLVASDTPPQFLFATCRNLDSATDLINMANEHRCIQIIKFDVRYESEYRTFMETVRSHVGDNGLNMLVNNAGGTVNPEGVCDVTKDSMMRLFEVNTVAPMMITLALLPLLRQAVNSSDMTNLCHQRASVFNISSLLASVTNNTTGGSYSYKASKSALNNVTRTLHNDLSGEGILCMCLHPGWAKTKMGGPNATTSTSVCVEGLLKVIGSAGDAQAGGFYTFEGDMLPW